MPVSVQWADDEKSIMLWVFEGHWTWDDYYGIRDAANKQVSEVGYEVDLIIDMSGSSALPSGVLTHARSAFSASPSNIGFTVFVGLSPVLRSFYTMFSKLYHWMLSQKKLEMVMVATRDEAYEFIKTRRAAPR